MFDNDFGKTAAKLIGIWMLGFLFSTAIIVGSILVILWACDIF
jgi:hypothetical protein